MKKMLLLFLTLVLFCVLAACSWIDMLNDGTVSIQGTVTVTRNGLPWNYDFNPYTRRNNSSRDPGPPSDRPEITAYSKGRVYIGVASVRYDKGSADYSNGTYHWTLKISKDKIPCPVYFEVSCLMSDVNNSRSRLIKTEEFFINDKDTVIDIGLINFNVVRLSGNLPITINGEALEEYSSGRMLISLGSSIGWDEAYIRSNGDWSLNIFQPDSEIPAIFRVEVKQLGGTFRKTLNLDDAIMIYDTDLEVNFPDFESVDLEALVLSGTLKLPAPRGSRLHIYLYYGDYTGSNSDTELCWQEIVPPEPDKNGLFKWKAMIPVYPIPFDMTARTQFIKYNGSSPPDIYKAETKIVITETADLSNINLGDLRL